MAIDALRELRAAAIGLALGALLFGCSPREGGIADPLQRNFQWFNYVGGDDIRAACTPNAMPRYRFVYNAVWEEQVRTYDLERLPAGQGALLTVNVIRGAPRLLQAYVFGGPNAGTVTAQARLSEAEYLDIARSTEAAGFGRRPPDGTRLQSYDFYWLVNACAAGAWHLNAWRRQDPGFDQLRFDALLFSHDPTGIAINPVRRVNNADRKLRYGEAGFEHGRADGDAFELVIRGGRLAGNLSLF